VSAGTAYAECDRRPGGESSSKRDRCRAIDACDDPWLVVLMLLVNANRASMSLYCVGLRRSPVRYNHCGGHRPLMKQWERVVLRVSLVAGRNLSAILDDGLTHDVVKRC